MRIFRATRWPAACMAVVLFAADGAAASEETGESPASAVEEPGQAVREPLPDVQPPVIQVDEVSVTAARAERAVLDQPGNITIITREDILESGVTTIPELLRREAGVYVTNFAGPNPTGVNVEVRGFNNFSGNGSRTLVLVDGRRANLPQTGNADWALMRIDDVERIEIVRGPASAVYGDNAMAGVIQIITRQATERFQAESTARGGSYGTARGSLFAGGSVGDFSGSVFLDGLTSNGYRERSDFRTNAAKGNLRYTLGDRFSVRVEGGYSNDKRDFPGTLSQSQIDTLGRQAANPGISIDHWKVSSGFAQLAVEGELAEGVVLKLQPTWRSWDQEGGFVGTSFVFDSRSNTSTTTVNGQLEVDRSLGPVGSRLVVGGDWLYETDRRLSTSNFGNFDASNRRWIASGYLEEELEPLEGLLIAGGVRYDAARYHERNFVSGDDLVTHMDQWSPKASVTYRVLDPASVYFSYARGFRFPNFDEIYPVFDNPTAQTLEPETSISYEFGGKFRTDQVRAGVALYWMDVDDEMLYDPLAGAFGFGQNENIDRVRHRGVEVEARYQPWKWVEVYATYTYDNTEIQRYALDRNIEGKQLPITPENRGTVGLNFFLPVPKIDVFELGVNANIVGSRYVFSDLQNSIPQLPTYGTVDLHGRVEKNFWETLDLAFFFDIRNVGNEAYSDVAGIAFVDGPVRYYPAPGTNFEIGISIGVKR